jgi:hypothetical protein
VLLRVSSAVYSYISKNIRNAISNSTINAEKATEGIAPCNKCISLVKARLMLRYMAHLNERHAVDENTAIAHAETVSNRLHEQIRQARKKRLDGKDTPDRH